MTSDRTRIALALVAAWGLVLAAIAATALLVGADLSEAQRRLLAGVLEERAASVVVVSLLLLVPLVFILRALFARYVRAPRRLAEDARIMLTANPAHRAPLAGSAEVRRLAEGVNALADAHEALRSDVERRVREANARLEQERNRLAALMSELAQSVIVCNVEGRILLYNARAMQSLRKPVEGDASGRGPSLVGLGRSVFAIFDRGLIIHALDTIQERLRQGTQGPVAHFVTAAPSGALVRVRMAPVFGAAESSAGSGITGYVLILDDITRRIESGNRRDLLLQTLTQGTRASLGSIRAAVETIAAFPEMTGEERNRFVAVIGDEARALTARLDATVGEFADSLRTEWPLEEMRGADLIAAARRRIEAKTGLPTKLEAVDESAWVKVDSYSLIQAIAYLASRLEDEFGIRELRFGLAAEGALAHVDLIWTGAPLGTETTMAWQTDSMELGGEACPLTLKQIVERHGGEIWYQIHKPSQREFFRVAIPVAVPEESAWTALPTGGSRPEYYDFDLFHQPGQTAEQDDRPLASLTYTVFDTETTGLAPSGGDEIVSIGAVRIVNGRLLVHEVFEQLIDPGRPMSADASRVTGIESAMLAGQPPIAKVLPAFHEFCADTVLIAHNASFDLRFLRLKEEASGVRFTQPVLDTLLLSAIVHPGLDGHGLEAIAERLGVNPIGRHTALGDAIMTGEVFLRMLPLLAEQGIRTLGEAREASQKTYFARLQY
ncbi:MAG TPA: exonuclease domain-containing protein [Casimicrobiaceae bacterium]|nr:exonuclease domain-containing protein [Casimicrobiaceae bacterium]